jgi:hypothetical protein
VFEKWVRSVVGQKWRLDCLHPSRRTDSKFLLSAPWFFPFWILDSNKIPSPTRHQQISIENCLGLQRRFLWVAAMAATGSKARHKNGGHNGTVYWKFGMHKAKERDARNVKTDEIRNNGSSRRWAVLLMFLLVVAAVILVVFSMRGGIELNIKVVPSLSPAVPQNNKTALPGRRPALTPVGSNATDSSGSITSCMMPGTAGFHAGENVDPTIHDCADNRCVIYVDRMRAYQGFTQACQDVRGVLHLFSMEIGCAKASVHFNNWPVCWISPNDNPACTVDSATATIDPGLGFQDCLQEIVHTGTTDFSGYGPVTSVSTTPPGSSSSPSGTLPGSGEVVPRAVDAARHDVDAAVAPDANASTSVKAESFQESSPNAGEAVAANRKVRMSVVVLTPLDAPTSIQRLSRMLTRKKPSIAKEIMATDNCTASAVHD